MVLHEKSKLKLIIFPTRKHHLCLPVITCIASASVLDWTLACSEYSHICWDHIIFTVNVYSGMYFCSFILKQKQHIMPMDQVFGPSTIIEQKHFCFFRSSLCILVISRVFKYVITKYWFERFQHKFFLHSWVVQLLWGFYFYLYHESVYL